MQRFFEVSSALSGRADGDFVDEAVLTLIQCADGKNENIAFPSKGNPNISHEITTKIYR